MACSDDRSFVSAGPAPSVPRATLLASVTGPAAALVGDDGLFRLAVPAPSGLPEFTEERARDFAAAYTRQFAPMIRATLERDHRGPIDLAALRLCPRTFYAQSALEPAGSDLPGYIRRLYGPRWLVSMCAPSGEAQLSIAVSAYATDVELRDGRLDLPEQSGEEFQVSGIPKTHGALPVTPERAVEIVARLTGRKVIGTPELILPVRGQDPVADWPQQARWRLRLDGPAALRRQRDLANVNTDEVYVGVQAFPEPPQAAIASTTQPAEVGFGYVPPQSQGATREQRSQALRNRHTGQLRRRSGMAVTFERATGATTDGGI